MGFYLRLCNGGDSYVRRVPYAVKSYVSCSSGLESFKRGLREKMCHCLSCSTLLCQLPGPWSSEALLHLSSGLNPWPFYAVVKPLPSQAPSWPWPWPYVSRMNLSPRLFKMLSQFRHSQKKLSKPAVSSLYKSATPASHCYICRRQKLEAASTIQRLQELPLSLPLVMSCAWCVPWESLTCLKGAKASTLHSQSHLRCVPKQKVILLFN